MGTWKQQIERLITEIENRFGDYASEPNIVLIPDLYVKFGVFGRMHVANGVPKSIELEQNLLQSSMLQVLTHELLEWRFTERGERSPHELSNRYAPEILARAISIPAGVGAASRPYYRERRARSSIRKEILQLCIEKPGIAKQAIVRGANLNPASAELYLSELLDHEMLTRVKMYYRQSKIWRYFISKKGIRYVIVATEIEEILEGR